MYRRAHTGAPLAAALRQHAEQGQASFHTPGHKGRAVFTAGFPVTHDLTELPDTGSLYDGGDAIEAAEVLAADAFGAAVTAFSGGGCTLCIQAMLMLAAGTGGRVLMARGCHRSAVHAAALLGIRPIWLWPDYDDQGDIQPISAAAIDAALKACPDIRAVYITSPDYYGNLCDVAAIAAVCRAHDRPLLVDNAHGSHLGAFGLHPLALGAAMTADSAHKTLPVLTGGAYLHVGQRGETPPVGRADIKAAMALFGSTSPSFPVLESLDLARDWWVYGGRDAYRRLGDDVAYLREAADSLGLLAFGPPAKRLRDPTRLTLDIRGCAVDGGQAADFFRRCGCEPEMADDRYVVFIITPFNTEQELQRLEDALRLLPSLSPTGRAPRRFSARPAPQHPTAVLSPREALGCPVEDLPAAQCVGRIAARALCPCPPGVAVVVPGEQISPETAVFLSECGYTHLPVLKNL